MNDEMKKEYTLTFFLGIVLTFSLLLGWLAVLLNLMLPTTYKFLDQDILSMIQSFTIFFSIGYFFGKTEGKNE